MGLRILKSKRILFNLTQEEIAKEVGINIKSYNLKENGKREFTLDEAKKISNLLELNLNEVNDIFFDSSISG
ncbi:MAG: helix-turn-helix transcriptional regulator [Romboutsia timonensis]|uniref:helix-turn-helix transcriptional regulator n=1 Tax=Romboutsia timonensis TaxID=1776391 RepID=UPI002A757636|nr:helix-turn-helix transcriptional regulator [Romboutsia timonensis]MDY3000413.1 helix-turn-helix transcriptional regulator [Romboutsia timonensis]